MYSRGASATARSVQPTADGGYIIAGSTYSPGAGENDLWLIKTDAQGDTQWTRVYGGGADDGAFCVDLAFDGGFIVTGITASFGAGNYDVWLLKTDAQGDTQWTRTFGGTSWDYGMSVCQTSDSGYAVAGTTRSFGAGRTDLWLLKTDASGDTQWTRTYGDPMDEGGWSVAQTADGGFIVAGEDKPVMSSACCDVYLVRTDARGDTLWTRTFGDSATHDVGYSVAQTIDHGFVVVGRSGEYCWLIKADSLGDTLWSRRYGAGFELCGSSVALSPDSGYVLAGWFWSQTRSAEVWLARTDSLGDTGWTRTFGGTYEDMAYCVAPTRDGGFVLAGHKGTSPDSAAVYMVKTDSNGQVGVAEPRPPSAARPSPSATVCRGVLSLPPSPFALRTSLFSPAGRKVAELRPGRNDVRHLSPGAYFVRSGTNPVRKVLIVE
ncbi:hypothetical protein FJY71_05495 [candidate division WOR-3 bacterium]|nr:hypothetical protein [candidate division WOR-3 bacterium]